MAYTGVGVHRGKGSSTRRLAMPTTGNDTTPARRTTIPPCSTLPTTQTHDPCLHKTPMYPKLVPHRALQGPGIATNTAYTHNRAPSSTITHSLCDPPGLHRFWCAKLSLASLPQAAQIHTTAHNNTPHRHTMPCMYHLLACTAPRAASCRWLHAKSRSVRPANHTHAVTTKCHTTSKHSALCAVF